MTDKFDCTPVGLEFLTTAPHRFTASATIKATPSQIFDAFEDADTWTRWATPIQKVVWTSPKPFGLGTTREVHMAGNMVGYEEFIAWERGVRMAFCFLQCSHDSVQSFAEDYQLTDNGDGTVTVDWVMAMQPNGISKVILPIIGPLQSFLLRRWINKFKKIVEKEFTQ